MSVSAFTTALLLTTSPVDAADTARFTPGLLVTAAVSGQELGAPRATTDTPPAPATPDTATADSSTDAGHGEIVVKAQSRTSTPGDPLESINAASYDITQSVDKALVAPVAMAYKNALPEPVRAGIRNFFNNLGEPIVFLNYLLQLKPGKAFETVGRFAINSTIGAAGLFDIAKRRPFKLPRRSNGFANTFGYYGIKPGAFLFLPLVGPTTIRDFIGLTLDKLVLPVTIGKPFNTPAYTIPASIIGSIDYRVEFDAQLSKIRDESADPYAASRENYLQNRQREIDALHGKIKTPPPANIAPSPIATPKTGTVTPPDAPPAPAPVPPAPAPAPDQPLPPPQD